MKTKTHISLEPGNKKRSKFADEDEKNCSNKKQNEIETLKEQIADLKEQLEVANKQKTKNDDDKNKDIAWECFTDNGWLAYESSVTTVIEKSFKKGKPNCTFSILNIPYILTFNDMKQIRQDTIKTQRQVRRIEQNPSHYACLHEIPWSLPTTTTTTTPWILNDEAKGIRIKEIHRNQLNGKISRELYEFNIAVGHYYNLNTNKNYMKTITKIWVIEYSSHHQVLQRFEETRRKFRKNEKPKSKCHCCTIIFLI